MSPSPPPRLILLVEDDPADARLVQRAFQKAELRAGASAPVRRVPPRERRDLLSSPIWMTGVTLRLV